MIRVFFISLATVLIALGPALHELQKLPAIVSHFHHHRYVHGEADLGFVDYLVSHFGERSHQDSDHASLPFHSGSTCGGHTVVVPVTTAALCIPVSVVRMVAPESASALPSSLSTSIFQPPRV